MCSTAQQLTCNHYVPEGTLLIVKLLLLVLGLCCTVAFGQEKILWGNLHSGPYAVGFHSQYELDLTRDYDPAYPLDPAAPRVKKPRPIFIAYWYPSKQSQGRRMAYREYLEAHQPTAPVVDFANRLAAYN